MEPPLATDAVNVVAEPAQMVLLKVEIVTDGVAGLFTVTAIELEVAVSGIAQLALDVTIQVII